MRDEPSNRADGEPPNRSAKMTDAEVAAELRARQPLFDALAEEAARTRDAEGPQEPKTRTVKLVRAEGPQEPNQARAHRVEDVTG